MIKACIFDLDGTLLDTLTSLWYCSSESLRKEGLCVLPRENYRHYVGDGARTQVERYLRDTERDSNADPAVLHPGALLHDPHDPGDFPYYFDSYMRELDLHADYEVRPYEGIPELLDRMKAAGIRLAVFSNKPDPATVRVIRGAFGGELFDMVLGKREELPKKPDPAGVFMILEQLGVKPEETLYIGDTDTDMKTGKNAGLFTLGAAWGFRGRTELEKSGADAVIGRPEEMLRYAGI